MEVTESLYAWLQQFNVLREEASQEENFIYLDDRDAQAFESGLRFVPLIKRLNKVLNRLEREATPMPEINTLKDIGSAAAKLYN